MKIVELSLGRRVTVAMAAIAVCLFGAVSFTRLPINLLPDLSYPSLTVETKYPGAAPAEIEALVSRPIEEGVGVVAGVQRINSVSKPGLSQVTLEFGWGREMDFAALDVRQKLDLVSLPKEVSKPVLLRFDPSNDPVERLYLKGGEDLFQLRYLGEEVVKKDLESTAGVAAVKVHGGQEEEIEVRIDQGKLALLGLGIQEVRDRLARENINQAGGSLYEQEARYLVRARAELLDLDDIRNVTLLAEDGRTVSLGDVAVVTRGHKPREVITRFDGAEAVELAIYKEGDANTVAVARAVAERLERIRKELPSGVEVVTGVDQSRFIQSSIDEVLSNAIVGGLIAIVVLLLFLKDLRSTLVIGLSIPLSIIATFFLMDKTGTTLNVMSLGGLALGVGMLVDNAIVVLEAIYKRREAGEGPVDAALHGASEVGTAVIASTLTTVAVFVPVVFLEGIAAQLFRDQALTVSFSLLASLAVALTVIPGLTAAWGGAVEAVERRRLAEGAGRIRRGLFITLVTAPVAALRGVRAAGSALLAGASWLARPVGRAFDAALGSGQEAYPRALRWALAHRSTVALLALAAFGAALLVVPTLGLDLVPTISQGEFDFRVDLPEGTPLEVTDRTVAELAKGLDGDPRLESYSTIAGGAGLSLASTGAEGENVGRIQIRLAAGTTPEDEAGVIESLRATLEKVDGARFKLERPAVFAFRTPVEVELYGDDLEALHAASVRVRDRVAEIPGLVDVKSSSELGNPELLVTFNREQLVRFGLDLAQVAATVRNKVQGDVATRLTEGDREVDIVVRSVEAGEASVGEVADLIVGQRGGRPNDTDAGRSQRNPRRPDGADVDQMNRLDRFNLTGMAAQADLPTIPIRLKSVAEVHLAKGPSEIRRIGQKRAAVVAANIQDRDMATVNAEIAAALRGLDLGDVVAEVKGQQAEMQRSFSSLMLAMALAVFLVYLVMASQFESFLHPFVIAFTLPLGAIGVVFALVLTNTTVNVVALIGVVMLAGIVVNNAIVLIDAVNQKRRDGGLSRDEALVAAGRDRLRPILMTSATTVLGLLPMALGLGDGAELRAPLAITVIGGLTVATALTLIVIPVVYALLDRQRFPADAAQEDDDGDLLLETGPEAHPAGAAG